jgi:hypothetical protein
VSSWKKTEAGIVYEVIVPANSTATLRLDLEIGQKVSNKGQVLVSASSNYFTKQLKAGSYDFLIK